MKIAVIGSGAIGALVAGYLKNIGKDVFLVGHQDSVEAIRKNGLNISGVRSDMNVKLNIYSSANIKEDFDLAIIATKTQDVQFAVSCNLKKLEKSLVITTQNGVRADDIVTKFLPRENIISSIVMFGATYLEPGKVVHNFEGRWILGRPYIKNDEKLNEIAAICKKSFPVFITDDIWGMKWLKIFVNAHNCIPALLGKSMQEIYSDLDICKVSLSVWREGLEIVRKAGIKLVSLPDFSVERLKNISELSLDAGAKMFSNIMLSLSKEPIYGSILQSIKRGRPSEVDFINGEFVSLANNSGQLALLNERLTAMVHKVELTKKFFTKEELLAQAKEFIK